MNKLFLFFMMFIGLHINCMELYQVKKDEQQRIFLPEDVVYNVVRPYLDLQSWARLGQTCKTYEKIVGTGNKDKISSYFGFIKQNYYLCTRALGRFAAHEDATSFDCLWKFDSDEREKHIEKLVGKPVPLLADKMSIYRNYYGNLEEIDKQISEQLRDAIINKDSHDIRIILQSKKYNIFDLFNDHTIEVALKSMCQLNWDDVGGLLLLLPQETVDHKNRVVQYLCKYNSMNALCGLVKKDYLKVDEKDGNQCTLLHYAALCGFNVLTALLISKGANIHAVNTWCRQPLDYACSFEQKHLDNGVVALLKNSCEQKHILAGKKRYKCSLTGLCHYFSTNEVDWLRNFCNYSLK